MKNYFVLLLIVVLTTSCNRTITYTASKANRELIHRIETSLNVTFPDSTSWIGVIVNHYHRSSNDIDYLYCCIMMSRNDLAKTFPDNTFTWNTDSRNVFNSQGDNENWFKPDDIKTFKSFQARFPDNKHVLNVLTERDNPDSKEKVVLVYIVWYPR